MAYSPDHYYHVQPSSPLPQPAHQPPPTSSQHLRHSKTDPSLSSNLSPIYPSDTTSAALKTITSNHYGSTRTLNQHHYAEMRHYHSSHHHHFCGHQISSVGNYFGMPAPSSCNDGGGGGGNTNNKLVHRHHYQNTAAVHPYLVQPICSCCPSGSQIMSPTSPSAAATSFRPRMFSHFKDVPVTFEAPELSEETILDKAHHETLAKLNFVLALVDSLLEFINNISSPITVLSESVTNEV